MRTVENQDRIFIFNVESFIGNKTFDLEETKYPQLFVINTIGLYKPISMVPLDTQFSSYYAFFFFCTAKINILYMKFSTRCTENTVMNTRHKKPKPH